MTQRIMFALLLALFAWKTAQSAKSGFELQVHNITCKALTDILKHTSCDFQRVERSRYAINVMFELTRQMPSNIDVNAMLFIKAERAAKAIKFFDFRLRVCDVLTKVLSVPLAKEIMKRVTSSSNIPWSCPVKANVMYNVTNLSVSDDLFPRYTPAIYFNCTLNFYDKQKMVAKFQLQGFRKQVS
uniref:MD-2-related lipid-recognition domain-containing protein n=1 Tax=Stomoxys calcitrans TaxID=35570 RepID=A0A1I8Q3S2_STOCA